MVKGAEEEALVVVAAAGPNVPVAKTRTRILARRKARQSPPTQKGPHLRKTQRPVMQPLTHLKRVHPKALRPQKARPQKARQKEARPQGAPRRLNNRPQPTPRWKRTRPLRRARQKKVRSVRSGYCGGGSVARAWLTIRCVSEPVTIWSENIGA